MIWDGRFDMLAVAMRNEGHEAGYRVPLFVRRPTISLRTGGCGETRWQVCGKMYDDDDDDDDEYEWARLAVVEKRFGS